MSKLPIPFLLYLTSLGLAVGSGWAFYQTMRLPKPMSGADVLAQAQGLLDKGRKSNSKEERDSYGDKDKPWWLTFNEANLTGKLPPEPTAVKSPEQEKPVARAVVPIEDLLDVICIVFDPEGGSRCVVRYDPSSNVQAPPEALRTPPTPATIAPPRDVRPGGPAQPASPPPVSHDPTRPVQHLHVGDSLWPPHNEISLARVEEDAAAVVFVRKGAAAAAGDNPAEANEEKVFKNELGLDKGVLEEFAKNAIVVRVGSAATPSTTTPVSSTSEWIEVEETRSVLPGQWHLSRKDNDYLRDNAQQVFNDDISVKSYVSKSGGISGLQVTKISQSLQRFGVQNGDVLLELNGVKVESKAQAIKVGKDLYRQGIRSFRAKILTRYGRIEERTYHAPNG